MLIVCFSSYSTGLHSISAEAARADYQERRKDYREATGLGGGSHGKLVAVGLADDCGPSSPQLLDTGGVKTVACTPSSTCDPAVVCRPSVQMVSCRMQC